MASRSPLLVLAFAVTVLCWAATCPPAAQAAVAYDGRVIVTEASWKSPGEEAFSGIASLEANQGKVVDTPAVHRKMSGPGKCGAAGRMLVCGSGFKCNITLDNYFHGSGKLFQQLNGFECEDGKVKEGDSLCLPPGVQTPPSYFNSLTGYLGRFRGLQN